MTKPGDDPEIPIAGGLSVRLPAAQSPDPPAGSPVLLVEQLALGELDEAEAARVRARIGDSEVLEQLERSNNEILNDYPPSKVAADIRRRLELIQLAEREPKRGRSWAPWVLAPSVLAAAAVVWIIVRDPEQTKIAERGPRVELVDDGQPEQTRIKGAVDPHLVIDRRTNAGHERLGAGEAVSEGDLLQISYVPAGRRHGVLLSIDGAGVVTLHHPAQVEDSPVLVDGNEIPLPHAYELDDAPSFERFVFVTRDGMQPSVAEVVVAAEELATNPSTARTQPLALPGAGWRQHAVLLRKAPTPARGEATPPSPAGDETQEPSP